MDITMKTYIKSIIAQAEAYEQCNVRLGNKYFDIANSMYTKLKEENRISEFKQLLHHDNIYVKIRAAAICLQFPDLQAYCEAMLTEIVNMRGDIGGAALSVLTTWYSGRMVF